MDVTEINQDSGLIKPMTTHVDMAEIECRLIYNDRRNSLDD